MALKIKQFNKNYIPPLILDDNLKRWDQPDRNNIVVGDKYALMSEDDFNKLQTFKESYHWLRNIGKMSKFKYGHDWNLYWYSYHNDPLKVSLHFRKIILID